MLSITNDQGKEVQMKPARSDHVAHRTALLRKTRGKCWWGCAETGILVRRWWQCKLVQPLWKMVWSVLKKTKLKRELPYNPAIQLFWLYIQRKWKPDLEDLHSHVQCSIIHNSQDMKNKCSSLDKEGYMVAMYTPQNIIQPCERKKFCHLQQPGWTLTASCYMK